MASNNDFVKKVLEIFWRYDSHNDLYWRVDDGVVTFFVNCNDQFYWGTADLETIEPEDVERLEKAFQDVLAIGADVEYAAALFAARNRGMRPQHAAYPFDQRDLWPLYDACGPPRVVGLGNPHQHPSVVVNVPN